MKKYRKKPVVVEVIQYTGENDDEIIEFVGEGNIGYQNNLIYGNPVSVLHIKTLEGYMMVSCDDYVIKGIQGEFYPCKPDIFKQTYEEVIDD